MAVAISKKDKLIEEAQRFALRGQLDKAISTYGQIVELEPSAINLRQKLAELLIKAGRAEDARIELETIGKYYSSNCFYLKAIAVYKQLQKLFPGDINITLTLAGLNEKHGLAGNALAEYKQAYDYFENSSNMVEAIKILDKMQTVDPGNINIKLKLAESYFQNGKKDESYAVFIRLASLLQERGDVAALSRLNARVQQLFPEKNVFMFEVLAEQVEQGNASGAVAGIQALLRNNPNDKRFWDLILEAYKKLNQPQRLRVACHHYLKFFPHELSPKKCLMECLVSEKNIDEALALLENYEQDFIRAGAAIDLVEIFKKLDEIDPVNVRLLEGLKRVYEATGDKESLVALESRLSSFKTVSGTTMPTEQPETSPVLPEDIKPFAGPDESTVTVESPPAPDDGYSALDNIALTELETLYDTGDDEIEIEIEIDEDVDFEGGETGREPPVSCADNWLDSAGDIFDSIANSPRGVKFGSDLDASDAQTHYDLGVAFKEMGLYDEAINEFRQAAADSSRKVECRIMQGICLREKGDPVMAESVLLKLLNPNLSIEEECSVKYELVLTFDALGRHDDAAKLLAEIDKALPGFRDVRSRLDSTGDENALDFSDEDLQGFDLK